jgi:hypothetical protein
LTGEVDQRIVAPRLDPAHSAHHRAGMGAGRLGQGAQAFALFGVGQVNRRVTGGTRAAGFGKCRIRQVGATIQDFLSLCHVGSPHLSEFL